MPRVDEESVGATQELMIQKLEETGRLHKLQAMVAEAGYQALHEGANADSSFTDSPELQDARQQGEEGMLQFRIVFDWLRHMGLNHTANLMKLEAGTLPCKLDVPRREFASAVGGDEGSPVLVQMMSGGARGTVATVAQISPDKGVSAPATEVDDDKKGKGEENLYEISGFTGGTFTRFNQIDGQQLNMWELSNCKIYVFDAVDSIQMDECKNCELYVAACEGSIFVRDCESVTVTAACKQLRTRDCDGLDLRLFGQTDPVIEQSCNVSFKPFNARSPLLIEKLQKARLDPKQNRFVHVYDFTPDAKLNGPHYTVHLEDHGLKMMDLGSHLGKPEAPAEFEMMLDGRIQPAASCESGSGKSHNIKTGSGTWTADGAPASAPAAAPVPTQAPPAPAAASPKATGSMAAANDSGSYSAYSDSSTPLSSVKDAATDSDDEF